MDCPICGSPMIREEVETRPARQEGGEIVDADYQMMEVCTVCENVEPIINEQEEE